MDRAKLRNGVFTFFCPGCKCFHRVPLKMGWTFNGNLESPTLTPSVYWPEHCHLYIEKGKIKFLDDCKHQLKNKTVDMQPLYFE